jgi:hypothetical protein
MIATIERAFAAIADDDPVRLADIFGEDFHAFENGVPMTGQELLDRMSRYYKEGRRYRWSVTSPQIELNGNLGVVIYVNRGSITEAPGADPIPMSWLERVVLRRQGSGWRLAFLHSTRTKAQSGA